MYRNPFAVDELSGRIEAVRTLLADLRLDAAVLSVPENVFYLTGLDHWGYFAPHLLVVPLEGEPVLVTRAMERVVVANQLRTAAFRGHSDEETAADEAARVPADIGLAGGHIGLEYWSWGFCHGLAESLKAQVDAVWEDISGLVDGLRAIKSPAEQALMRAAAKVTDAATAASVAASAAAQLRNARTFGSSHLSRLAIRQIPPSGDGQTRSGNGATSAPEASSSRQSARSAITMPAPITAALVAMSRLGKSSPLSGSTASTSKAASQSLQSVWSGVSCSSG